MTSIKFRALTHDDHKFFFEGLGEFGKDFQNIQQYMAQKSGKQSGTSKTSSEQNKSSIDAQEKRDHDKKEEDKKREQIRNFYNKLYTKLSQLVNLTGKIDDRVEKVNQELYLLINYGEIWKKHGFKFNNKTKKLLEELVFQGYTTFRFKNKNVRLRTPPCKALKKLNGIGIDEKEKVVTSRELPKEVIVEFHPATNRDWLRVQSMSQNPLVRARLSIQKRLSNILEFLENKWNVSQDKMNRTVDVLLKVPISSQSHLDNLNNNNSNNNNNINNNSNNGQQTNLTNGSANSVINTVRTGISENANSGEQIGDNLSRQKEVLMRLRLKPSAQHELKEVNITRVVPDNHLDLSLQAYIKRLGDAKPKSNESNVRANNLIRDSSNQISNNNDIEMLPVESCEISQSGGHSSGSHNLPLSLTTPDCSLFFERSCTSDQPSIAHQARKHLNILQSLAGTFEGCENSRTACEETQDRLSLGYNQVNEHSRSNFGSRVSMFLDHERQRVNLSPTKQLVQTTTIPALFDEDAAIDSNLEVITQGKRNSGQRSRPVIQSNQPNIDSQNSKSVDFHIPKNVTLGDFFRMNDQGDGDDANDAFSTNEIKDSIVEEHMDDSPIDEDNNNDSTNENISDNTSSANVSRQPESSATNNTKTHNLMIEIQKLAEGWTRQEDPSITIGELYLAFKCPDKIVLEYQFEQIFCDNRDQSPQNVSDGQVVNYTNVNRVGVDNPSNDGLIFRLLTVASLSLAQIERSKQEDQHNRLHDQSNAKLKRRKVQGQVRSLQDIEMNNQRVEEALKQLRSTKLTFKRAR